MVGSAAPAQANTGDPVLQGTDNGYPTRRTAVFTPNNTEIGILADPNQSGKGSLGVYGPGQNIGVLGEGGAAGAVGVTGTGDGGGSGVIGTGSSGSVRPGQPTAARCYRIKSIFARYEEIVMSRLYRIRTLATFLTALALLTLALAVSPRSAARAASTPTVTYTLATVSITPNTGSCDIPPCQVFSYTLAGTGTTTTPGAPAAQSFTWTLTPSKYANGNLCAATQGTGTVDIIWQDLSTTDVSFSFKARDAHTWAIKGQVASGTNTAFPPSPQTPAEGVVGYPPNPCTGATVTATLSLFPPQSF